MLIMLHVRKIGGTRIARSASRALIAKRSWEGREPSACVGVGCGPPGQYRSALRDLVRSERREAKTDAGYEDTWLCGCGAGNVRAHGVGRPRLEGRRGWAIHT